MAAREASSAVNAALAENVHGVRAIQELAREDVNFRLFEAKARANLMTHLTASKYTNVMIPIVDTLTGSAMAIVVVRSEEHTSELQSLMRISYAVFCLKKKKKITH